LLFISIRTAIKLFIKIYRKPWQFTNAIFAVLQLLSAHTVFVSIQYIAELANKSVSTWLE